MLGVIKIGLYQRNDQFTVLCLCLSLLAHLQVLSLILASCLLMTNFNGIFHLSITRDKLLMQSVINAFVLGLLGASPNPNRQRRLLLKVFAIADVVVYRCMSDRLHNDLFEFLADASDAFVGHFQPHLKHLVQQHDLPWSTRQLGPSVIIFQETRHTVPLAEDAGGIGPLPSAALLLVFS